MVVVSYSGKEINAKLVYYGPGLSGKTTNLEHIYKSVPQNSRGKMVSMKTRTERTLFFDFLPVDLGQLGGFKTRFLLYTVPGQVYYNATRKLVLRGVDAVVFVADSGRGKMKENLESLENLRENLRDYDMNLDDMPFVIQYNKRDLDDVYSVEELEAELNPQGVPYYEGVATTGDGVFECFRGIGQVLLKKLSKEIKLEERSASKMTMPETAGADAASAETEAPASPPRARSSSSTLPKVGKPKAQPKPAARAKSAAQPKPEPVASQTAAPEAKSESKVTPIASPEPVAAAEESRPQPAGQKFQFAPPQVHTLPAEPEKPGFWGRLFGKKPQSVDVPVTVATTQPSSLSVIDGEVDGDTEVVRVPVNLDSSQIKPGARIQIVLEITVGAAKDTKVA